MPGTSLSPLRTLAFTCLVAGVLAGCGGGTDAGCGPALREALDPAYLVHVVSSDPDVEYLSDPPTSGPHQQSPPISGVVTHRIPRPVQVGILERGDVLVQHHPDLPDGDLGALASLGGPQVVVAPNPDLPAPVVATAWVHKLSCEVVDVPTIEGFITERVGHGPES